jgi:hypothetical protein
MPETPVLIEIFDPPMCCSSGLCGPAVDPVLLKMQQAVIRIQKESDGQVRVERRQLSQDPGCFLQNPAVMALVTKGGTGILPITTVNKEVKKTNAYPTLDELQQWAAAARAHAQS